MLACVYVDQGADNCHLSLFTLILNPIALHIRPMTAKSEYHSLELNGETGQLERHVWRGKDDFRDKRHKGADDFRDNGKDDFRDKGKGDTKGADDDKGKGKGNEKGNDDRSEPASKGKGADKDKNKCKPKEPADKDKDKDKDKNKDDDEESDSDPDDPDPWGTEIERMRRTWKTLA
jgi:hypothetical protein